MNRKTARDVVNECGARMRYNVLTNHFVFHDAENNPFTMHGFRLQDLSKDELRKMLTAQVSAETLAAVRAAAANKHTDTDTDTED